MIEPDQKPIEPLLTAQDVARRLAISKSAAYRLMREALPTVRFGPGVVRVRECDLAKFIESRIVNK